MKLFKMLLIAMLMLMFVADDADARRKNKRSRRNQNSYRGGGITVKVGTYTYTWYGPGGRAEAFRRAHIRTGGRYLPRRNTTPVQRDVKQVEDLRFLTFPTILSAGGLLWFDDSEPSQKAAQKATQKSSEPVQKSAVAEEAKSRRCCGLIRALRAHAKAKRAARAKRREARRAACGKC